MIMRSLGIIVAMCMVSFALGQDTTNPFDLRYRPSQAPSQKILPKPDTSISIAEMPVVPPVQDTSVSLETTKTGSDEINPFEIEEEKPGSIDAGEKEVVDDLLKPETKVQEFMKPSRGVQIFFLLLSLLFLIFIVNVERSFVRDLWRVISNENYSSLHLRSQRNTMKRILLLMGYMVFVMQAGVFLFNTLRVFGYEGRLLDNVWTCIALIIIIYAVRHSVIGYLRWLFNNEKEMTLFSFDISIFNIMVGLVLLPINVLLLFGPEKFVMALIIIGLIVALAAYMLRQLRWMLTARHLIANSLFLFFIYLCAIEILPLWAVSKLFW